MPGTSLIRNPSTTHRLYSMRSGWDSALSVIGSLFSLIYVTIISTFEAFSKSIFN
ncbi:hypothetical protein bas27_0080 [Escherichia phage TrudiGerster]|uniref:Uncharacterized protein n=1 Tax=Escherichia phage TrudiGerster TaxID=2851991 RepID=A0AAE7W1P6_9CAUD|nr:hypothetical protein bas27_0080 [Escherichia phage TrudiGerster]